MIISGHSFHLYRNHRWTPFAPSLPRLLTVSVQKLDGSAAIGVKVVNQWLGSQNGEVVMTDGTGVARFQFGSSAAVPDPASGHYPFSFAITADGFKDSDAKLLHLGTIIGDWVRGVGDDNASHTQIEIQMRQVA